MPLAMPVELLTETRLQEGLGVRRSPGSMAPAAGDEQRASNEMARNGLGDLEY